jgi:hypothetical protein
MATTTNYGWTTPDDTALVKDGAAAIRTLGSSVDTTTKALNPSTTLGDIEYRSSTANTNTRLGIGSTGQVLTVAAGVPSWATPAAGGGVTLLSTTSLTGTSTTISSISGSYRNLYVVIEGVYTSGTLFQMYINSDSFSNYNLWGLNDTSSDDRSGQAVNMTRIGYLGKNSSGASNAFSGVVNIYNYATADNKTWTAFTSGKNASDQRTGTIVSGGYYGGAVTSIKFDLDGSSFGGGTAKVYGVN